MRIDIRTWMTLLCITYLLQVCVLIQQYRLKTNYRGIGWWLLWSASVAAGFSFLLLRQFPAIRSFSIVAQNGLFMLGAIFIYAGVLEFLGRRVPWRIILALFAGYVASFIGLVYFVDLIAVRAVILGLSISLAGFATARALFKYKLPAISATANAAAAVFLIHSMVFLYRTLMILSGAPVANIFSPEFFNALPYLDALVVGLLWTFGSILIVNQRLNAEIRTLSGILPICASCKKIRSASGRWVQMEAYISSHTEAGFSHGCCPDCAQAAMGDVEELIRDSRRANGA